jgi:hypothetical protein
MWGNGFETIGCNYSVDYRQAKYPIGRGPLAPRAYFQLNSKDIFSCQANSNWRANIRFHKYVDRFQFQKVREFFPCLPMQFGQDSFTRENWRIV